MIYPGMELSLILEIDISTMNTSTMWKMKMEKSSMLFVEKTQISGQRSFTLMIFNKRFPQFLLPSGMRDEILQTKYLIEDDYGF